MKQVSNLDEINQLLTENKEVLLSFSAAWCNPCKALKPKVEELSQEHVDISFLKIDIDENPEIASHFQIRSIPTLIHIKKDGKNAISGNVSMEQLKDFLGK